MFDRQLLFVFRPTPLVAGIISGAASLVTRGKGQSLDLDPYLYSYDPDYPELKVSYMVIVHSTAFSRDIWNFI